MSAPTTDRIPLSTAAARPLLVVGSVAYDNIVTPYDRGERILGGSASYASLAASYFAPCRLIGVVGHDFSPADRGRLEARGIDLDGLRHDPSGPTFFWAGRYHENFNRRDTTEIQLNVFEHFRPDLPDHFRATPYVLLGNIGPDLQNHVCDQVEAEAFILADSMDLWIETMRDELLRLLRRVDCFVLNDSEAELLTGEANLVTAGRKLLGLGPRMVVVKKGEHGAYLFHPEGLFVLPAYPVTELRDPTGAGDSFAGGLLGFLAAVDDTGFAAVKHAMAYATATASMTVEAFSCNRLESAGAAAIEGRYQELLQMVDLGELPPPATPK